VRLAGLSGRDSVAWLLAVATIACGEGAAPPPGGAPSAAARGRDAALAAARVWAEPRVPPGSVDFSRNSPGTGGFDPAEDVDCDFSLEPIGGTSPKFYCTLPGGERIKVKYGATNPEIPAEVAASRLLIALGFFVDRMMVVHSVRCRGCPPLPREALECLKKGVPAAVCLQGASAGGVRTFDEVMIERPFEGRKIEAAEDQGWAWFELDKIDPRQGGSARAEVDALRLTAVLLSHWDNKGSNQRLVCPPGSERADGTCRAPRAVVHDLGATFGPLKVDLQNWKQAPMWADAAACRVSMATLPYGGSTFADTPVTEEGRLLALRLLRALTPQQLNTLFEASGFSRFPHVLLAARQPQSWTDVFLAKVDQIAAAGPCPEEVDGRQGRR
jgi:hypothetical protein